MAYDSSLGQVLPADVVLEASDGSVRVEIMLARGADPNGNPLPKAWVMEEVPTPVNVRVSDTGAGLVDLPPEQEAVVYRDSHLGGLGAPLTINGKSDYESGVAYSGLDGYVTKPPSVSEITLPTSEGNVRCWFEFGSALYVSDGRYLHRSTNGTSFSQVLDVGAGGVITGGVAYGASDGDTGVVVGWEDSSGVSQRYYYSTDGITFVQPNAHATYQHSYYFVKDKTLYGLQQKNVFLTTTDPFTATPSWGTSTEIGDELHPFQGGFVVANVLVLFKTDRIFTVDDTGTVKTLVAQFANIPDSKNFQSFVAANNSNIYATVDNEVWEYDPVSGSIRPLGISRLPDTKINAASAYRDGVAFDSVGLLCLHHTQLPSESSPANSIMRIVLDSDGKPSYERWLRETPSGYYPQGPLHFSRTFTSLNTGRALFFPTTTAGKICRMDLFRGPNPTDDSSSLYTTVDTSLFTGSITHNFPGLVKDYTELSLDLGGLSATSLLSVFYYLDDDFATRYTLIEDIDTDGLYAVSFPEPTSARSIVLEFSFASSSTADSPVLKSWVLRGAVKFRLREVVQLTALVADGLTGRRGAKLVNNAAQIRARLRELRTKEGINVTYRDYRGYTFRNVRILPGFKEQDLQDSAAGPDITALSFRVMRVGED